MSATKIIIGKKYVVKLNEEESQTLNRLVTVGKSSARKIKRANLLIAADMGKTDQEISQLLHVSIPTIERTRKRYVEAGLEAALHEQPRCGRPIAFDAKQEATLIALACTPAPSGQARWTCLSLANRLVEMKVVDQISDESVRLRLKKVK